MLLETGNVANSTFTTPCVTKVCSRAIIHRWFAAEGLLASDRGWNDGCPRVCTAEDVLGHYVHHAFWHLADNTFRLLHAALPIVTSCGVGEYHCQRLQFCNMLCKYLACTPISFSIASSRHQHGAHVPHVCTVSRLWRLCQDRGAACVGKWVRRCALLQVLQQRSTQHTVHPQYLK